MNNWTATDVQKLLSNPGYCLSKCDDFFTTEHEPMISEEEWKKANTKLIEEIGPEKWLTLLLENLKGNFIKSVKPEEN